MRNFLLKTIFALPLILMSILSCSKQPDLALAPSAQSNTSGALAGAPAGFVYKEGTKLKLDGKDFRFQGTNLYDLALLSNGKDQARVQWYIQQCASIGLKVIRFWGFFNGGSNSIQPHVYQLNETALVRVDWVMKCCKDNNIKVIFPFVNYEPNYGGFDFYVNEVLGSGKEKELFYTDTDVRNAYKWYVRNIIQRRNTFTGTYYYNDPTILAWELANEPHTSDNYEINRGMTPGDLTYNWIKEMSEYIKYNLDGNHLVCTGEEGYRTEGATGTGHDWLNNGLKGVNFTKNASIGTIDFMTIHVYPDNWDIKPAEWSWVLENFMNDRAKIAFAYNKPIIMEESGYKKAYAFQASPQYGRDELLKQMSLKAYDYGFSGNMVWQFTPETVDDFSYDFDFSDNGSWAIKESAKKFNGLNINSLAGSNGTISPSGLVPVSSGASQLFTITPNSGFDVDYVMVDGVNMGAITSYTFSNVTVNHTITAEFKAGIQLTKETVVAATASSEENDNGTIRRASFTIDDNASTTRWASAYSDPQWIMFDLGSPKAIVSVVLDWETANAKNFIIEGSNDATFATKTTLATRSNMAAINHRIDSIGGLTGQYRYYRMFGTARNGTWGYSIWEARLYSNGSSPKYTLTGSAANGSITLNPAGGAYDPGTTVSLTAIPNTGYHFVNWTGDATGTSASTSITMNSNKSVTANFAINTFTITSSAGANGTITPGGATIVDYNRSQVYSINPNSGYAVDAVTVDGVNQGAITSYTFNNVTANHTIAASFRVSNVETKLTIVSATASSEENDNGTLRRAAYVFDGNATTTRWSSNYSDPQWIYVDLGSAKSVTRVRLLWEFASAKNYIIEGSNTSDFSTKTTLSTKTNMANGARTDSITGLSGSYRYIRMYGTARTSIYGYSLWELEVYGY
jgi:mannan endo-1,4-beta-mannosidase